MPEEVAHEWPVHIREIVIPKKRKPESFLSSLSIFGIKKARLPMSVSSPRPIRISSTSEGVTPIMPLPIIETNSSDDESEDDAINPNEAMAIRLPLIRPGFAHEPVTDSEDDDESSSDSSDDDSEWHHVQARLQESDVRSISRGFNIINEEENKLDNNINGEDEKEDQDEEHDDEDDDDDDEDDEAAELDGQSDNGIGAFHFLPIHAMRPSDLSDEEEGEDMFGSDSSDYE
eukprot:TRINITY_DN7828_c0_g1_i1.p1 TRINITY_DN7828_c0_g1~~TRINITY_DN7828_c0_g1_i1.p1  ORF type:complete len:231 (+),score=63.51 TRINITY_DN7828_c0_g1_i1:192-884(+)